MGRCPVLMLVPFWGFYLQCSNNYKIKMYFGQSIFGGTTRKVSKPADDFFWYNE
jgi:hypothetical protein